MEIARVALANAKVLVFVTLVLAALGVRAYTLTPQSIFPTMSFSKIDVVAEAGNLPPDRVRVAVALPLETAFQSLANVTRVRATSSQGSAELLVDFQPTTDPRVALEATNQAIAQIRSGLAGADNVVAVIVDPNSEPILSYAMTSTSLSQAVMRDFALHTLVPKLFGITGLGRILVTGGPTAEFHVRLDPAALAQHGLGAADVARALSEANVVRAVGTQQRYYQKYAIVIDASLKDIASLKQTQVPDKNGNVVPLSSLATIELGVSPVTDQASYDARHAVVINAYPVAGADTVKMAQEFNARLGSLAKGLPREIALHKFWDQTTLVLASQRSLRDAILLGALLAVLVIYSFLRSLRLTLVAAAVIPIAMAIAVFALQLAHQTLNLMSVGGLAVAVGLIIDDAIVVIEAIARYLRERPELSKSEAITLAMQQLAGPMTASTATTVVVFLPLGLLSGVTGYFFRALAFTLSVSLVVSLALALFIAPNFARALYRDDARGERGGGFVARVLDHYDNVLRWSLGHRVAVYGAAAAVLLATTVLLAGLPSDFLPKMDEGEFEVGYAMPTGTTLAATDSASQAMERIVLSDPGVAAVGRLTGVDSNGFSPTPQNKGLLRVTLKPAARAGYEEISGRLRARLQATIPSATYNFHQILEDLINDLSGTPAPLEIVIRGKEQAGLIELAKALAERIRTVPGVVDPQNGIVYDSPTLRLEPRGARLAALGLTATDIGDAVSALTQGTVATSISGPAAQVPVRVSIAAPAGANDFTSAPLYAKGGVTSLGDLARIAPHALASDQNDQNGERVVRVTANIEGANLSAVVARIEQLLAAHPPPPGYTQEIGGQFAVQQASFREFANVIAIAIALVFSVMLATFHSYRLPLVIITAIPLALIGVALGLFLTRTPFNVSSFMGLLLLVGIVVKNGILLIDVANVRRRGGASVEEALSAAGRTRLRPIVMTTLAAIGGLLPLGIGLGQGSEMEKPLAIAVIGGLSTATLFTLVVIPVLYATFLGRSAAPAAAA